jgi:GTP-binding protein Era
MTHRAGFVNILGNPNVGKSTLMNALVGQKLSIVSPKVQTTRHRIMGIVNGEDYQIVYSDTPGILKPSYKLHETMLKSVKTALTDADILIYITDINETFEKNEEVMKKLKKTSVPVLLLINKIDLAAADQVEKMIPEWQAILPNSQVFAISALKSFNLDGLLARIQELLPESPAYYPKDDLSDRNERFFVSEIIREKIFFNYREEIPYSCEVVVESFEEENTIIRIAAIIYVARDSQKGIIIGNKGAALKKTGTQARLDMEKFLGKKVFLQLLVKESKDWRNVEKKLKEFGYQ